MKVVIDTVEVVFAALLSVESGLGRDELFALNEGCQKYFRKQETDFSTAAIERVLEAKEILKDAVKATNEPQSHCVLIDAWAESTVAKIRSGLQERTSAELVQREYRREPLAVK